METLKHEAKKKLYKSSKKFWVKKIFFLLFFSSNSFSKVSVLIVVQDNAKMPALVTICANYSRKKEK